MQLEQALFQFMTDEFICKIAKSLKEASDVVEAGFDYVTEMDGCKIFKKRKTSMTLLKVANDAKGVVG